MLFLAACQSKSKEPAPIGQTTATPASTGGSQSTSADVQNKLKEAAGNAANDCGQVHSMSANDLKPASDCAMDAAKSKRPFYVTYEMPGMTVGIAGNSDGKLFTAQSEEQNGQPAPPKLDPCPAELRVAQSGRVTCMPAGSMAMPGGSNPHGMAAPPPGTPNPHKMPAPQKSH